MICDDARPLLDPLYDGALNSRDTALVLEHLKNCGTCDQEWHEMDSFRARFQSARNATIVPEGLTNRITATLNKEDKGLRAKFFERQMRTAPLWLVAAAVLLIGFLVLPNYFHSHRFDSSGALAVNTLFDDFDRDKSVTRVANDPSLVKKLGFEPKFIKMTGWSMQEASVYKSPSNATMARFDFASTKYGEKLYCFQAMAGALEFKGVEPIDVAGKSVRFGQHGKFQFALWSQNDRQYLLLTPLPKETLTEIVRNA